MAGDEIRDVSSEMKGLLEKSIDVASEALKTKGKNKDAVKAFVDCYEEFREYIINLDRRDLTLPEEKIYHDGKEFLDNHRVIYELSKRRLEAMGAREQGLDGTDYTKVGGMF